MNARCCKFGGLNVSALRITATTTTEDRPMSTLAQQLARGAQLLSRDTASPDDETVFQAALGQLLSLGALGEHQELQQAIAVLQARDDMNACSWLLQEVETESEYQYVPDLRGRAKPCVLFAIPIVFPAGLPLPTHLQADQRWDDLHEALDVGRVFDPAASFAIIPQLFTAEQLRGQSSGALRALTRSLGEQLLEQGESALYLDDSLLDEDLVDIDNLSRFDNAQLRFFVGTASADESAISELFAAALREENATEEAVGALEAWEPAVVTALCDYLPDEAEVLLIGTPGGFNEDLRFGLKLLREANAQEKLQGLSAQDERWSSPNATTEGLLLDESKTLVGVELCLRAEYLSAQGWDSVEWPFFAFESTEEAMEALPDMWPTRAKQGPRADSVFQTPPSYHLH